MVDIKIPEKDVTISFPDDMDKQEMDKIIRRDFYGEQEPDISPLKSLKEGVVGAGRGLMTSLEALRGGVSAEKIAPSMLPLGMTPEMISGKEAERERVQAIREDVGGELYSDVPYQERALIKARDKWLKPDETLKRPDGFKGYVQDVVKAMPQIGIAAGATALGGPAAGMATTGTIIAGGQTEKLIGGGVDPEGAWKAGFRTAIAQAPLELIGLSKALKFWKPGKAAKKTIKDLAEVGGTEFITEWMQKYPEYVNDILAKGKGKQIGTLFDEFVEGFGQATKEGMYEGLVAAPIGVGMGAGGVAARKIAERKAPGVTQDVQDVTQKITQDYAAGKISDEHLDALIENTDDPALIDSLKNVKRFAEAQGLKPTESTITPEIVEEAVGVSEPDFTAAESAEILKTAPEIPTTAQEAAQVFEEAGDSIQRARQANQEVIDQADIEQGVPPKIPEEIAPKKREMFQSEASLAKDKLDQLQSEGQLDFKSKDVLDAVAALHIDPVSGFSEARMGSARPKTINRAKDFIKGRPDTNATYVEMDLRNLGGLNNEFGSTGANEVYRAFGDIIGKHLDGIDADVSKFRHGGDELSAVIVGGDVDSINNAMVGAINEIQDMANVTEGPETKTLLSEIPHTKEGMPPGVGVVFATSRITPDLSIKDITKQADQKLELRKKGKDYEYERQIGTIGDGPLGREGIVEAAQRADQPAQPESGPIGITEEAAQRLTPHQLDSVDRVPQDIRTQSQKAAADNDATFAGFEDGMYYFNDNQNNSTIGVKDIANLKTKIDNNRKAFDKTKKSLTNILKDEKGRAGIIEDLTKFIYDQGVAGVNTVKDLSARVKQQFPNIYNKIKNKLGELFNFLIRPLRNQIGAIEGRGLKKPKPMTQSEKDALWNKYFEKTQIVSKSELARKSKPKEPGKKTAVKTKATQTAKEIAEARIIEKEVITQEETEAKANQLLSRKGAAKRLQKKFEKLIGGQLSTEMLALRKVYAAGNQILADVFNDVAEGKRPQSDLVAEMERIKNTSDSQIFEGMTSEVGRTMNILKRDVGPQLIFDTYKDLDGKLNDRQMELVKKTIKKMLDGTMSAKDIKNFKDEIKDPSVEDQLIEYWYNAILSGPPTHLVNTLSNTLWSAWQLPHRAGVGAVDYLWNGLRGKDRQYYMSEVIPMFAGYKSGFKRGAKGAWQMFAKGTLKDENADFETKWTQEAGYMKSALARSKSPTVRKLAPALTVSMRAMQAMDIWAKAIAYDGSLQTQAYRMARDEGLKGDAAKYKANETVKGWTNNLKSMPEEIHTQAIKDADYATFMSRPDPLTAKFIQMRNIPGLKLISKIFVPFVNTIANLSKRGIEMTPGLGVGKEYISRAMGRGQSNQEIIAKQIEGLMIASSIVGMAASGMITGAYPEKKGERELWQRKGIKPYSVKIGDKYYSYQRMEPFNLVIESAAALHDDMIAAPEGTDFTDRIMNLGNQIKFNLIDGSFLSGVKQTLNRHDSRRGMIPRYVASWMPYSGFARSMNRGIEAALNDGQVTFKDEDNEWRKAFYTVIPGLSGKLPDKLDLWGEKSVVPGGIFRQWLPYKWSEEKKDIVEDELMNIGYYPLGPEKQLKIGNKSYKLDKDEYKDYAVNFGAELKKQFKNVVESKSWKNKTNDEKNIILRRIRSKVQRAISGKAKQNILKKRKK